jgi:RNA polymerase sigma-70 factor (ECF subfamily)
MARVAYAIVGDPAMADDAVQSAWVHAWRKLGSVRDPERIRYWLLTIVVNESRQSLRRKRRTVVVELDMGQLAADRSDPSVGIARLDLAQALSRLSADDRALLALRYVAGFDAAEIGRVTGRTAGGTRVRLSRLTAQLRGELSK